MNDHLRVNRVSFIAIIVLGLIYVLYGHLLGFPECQLKKVHGLECNSCGLTRDLLSFFTLDFDKPINPNSIYVFLFIISQIAFRSIISISRFNKLRSLVMFDFFFTPICFLVCIITPYWL